MFVIYSEWVFVALGIQHATRMRHNVICGLSGSKIYIFSHYLIKDTTFRTKLLCAKYVLGFSANFVRNISVSNNNYSAKYYHKCVPAFM